MKVEKLLIGRLYKCTYPNREGEYVYVGEHLIGYCFNGCGGNRNIAMSERMVEKYIHETDQAHFTKDINLTKEKMERDDIEKAAKHYQEKDHDIWTGKGMATELQKAFRSGAEWRIKNVWHDMKSEEPQVYG